MKYIYPPLKKIHIYKLEKFHYFGVSIYCVSGSIKWMFCTVILYKNAEEKKIKKKNAEELSINYYKSKGNYFNLIINHNSLSTAQLSWFHMRNIW